LRKYTNGLETKMRIFDYETTKNLSDVGIFLSREEAEDLIVTLQRLVKQPMLNRVFLSDIEGSHIEREIAIAIEEPRSLVSNEPSLLFAQSA
jgi:hypothetical protein